MPSGAGGQKVQGTGPLKVELWTAVSHPVGARTEPQSSARAVSGLLYSHFSRPLNMFLSINSECSIQLYLWRVFVGAQSMLTTLPSLRTYFRVLGPVRDH